MIDLIDREQALKALRGAEAITYAFGYHNVYEAIRRVPSAQTETCDGCKHKGKWENEIENGYDSPCTICKRKVKDNYER